MKKLKLILWFLFCFGTVSIFGQISPGPLAESHSHLEGISNCTQCHDLGNKVPDTKCLDCHKEIDDLIKANRGYHVSSEIGDNACKDCHNDHHGRKFQMIRFEEDGFDHDLAGYTLKGKHKEVDCRACHTPDNIFDAELKKRENTYLGLDDKCLTCHDDYHQNTLDNDCVKCHDFQSFRPANLFDHDRAEFKLEGAHSDVECIECHKITTKNGKEFQEFVDLEFNDCKSCHDDPHNSNLVGKCKQCHSVESFNELKGMNRFNHNLTNFELKGSHKNVNCFECHSPEVTPLSVFQDRLDIAENNCVACHEDVHDGKFGLDCAKCHTEESFLSLKNMDFFDHNLTDYPLEGMHIDVDCKECHKGRFTDEVAFSNCFDCHEDYHNGEFTSGESRKDCKECHLLEEPFTYTMFGLEDHDNADFVLEGSHVATPCFSCHLSEDHWNFRDIGESCVDCHDNIHEGFISEKYYPDQDCSACHNSDLWRDVNFDHTNTDWTLEGQHAEVECRLCHFDYTENNLTFTQSFIDLSQECASCHENVHGEQFQLDGITDCSRCHDSNSWFPNAFDHNNTSFPLEGKHADLECNACHFPEDSSISSDRSKINYKNGKLECMDCHS